MSLHIYKAVSFCIYKSLTKQNLKMETIGTEFLKTFSLEQLHKTFHTTLSQFLNSLKQKHSKNN